MNLTLHSPQHLWSELVGDLLATPQLERSAIAYAGVTRLRGERRLLLRDWSPVASDQYVTQLAHHLEVSPVVYARAAARARRTGEAIVILHSHPSDPGTPEFSASDTAGEQRLLPKIQARANVPIVSIVVSPGGRRLRAVDAKGKRIAASLRLLGEPREAAPRGEEKTLERFDRQVRAIGAPGQRILRTLRVGIVGAGGLGSHVIQQLCHLGVGELVVLDDDGVDESNLSRLVGARSNDARARVPKARIASRIARGLGGKTKVRARSGSVLDEASARALLACDLIVGCTDTHWSRAVLNALAFQYYVPVVDCGVELQAGTGAMGGRITWLLPGGPCLWCLGILDAERVRAEQLPEHIARLHADRGYVPDLAIQAPAVVSINGVVASLAVTELLARFTGFASARERPHMLVYRLGEGIVRRVGVSAPGCPTCHREGSLGAGDLTPAPWRPSAQADNQLAPTRKSPEHRESPA
jgi:molybdopterin-synthase adenylyltransferase